MSCVRDHSKKYKILEELEVKYPCPDLDKILPASVYELEEKLSYEEYQKFIIKHFNVFYSKYVKSNVKELFVCLPLEFFTKENVRRVIWYANEAFPYYEEKCESEHNGLDPKFYSKLHERFLEIIVKKRKELETKTLNAEKYV